MKYFLRFKGAHPALLDGAIASMYPMSESFRVPSGEIRYLTGLSIGGQDIVIKTGLRVEDMEGVGDILVPL